MSKRIRMSLSAASFFLVMTLVLQAGVAFADHNGAVVGIDKPGDPAACSPTDFNAGIADPGGTHVVDNMYLVVDTEDDDELAKQIPIDGTTETISVGPFNQDTTVSWRVFGGGERSYDDPEWNGFGDSDFGSDINAYADEVGGFGWTIAGTDDPNPFTTWNEEEVVGCYPEEKDDCKKGGWADFGFKNQGLCIQFVETGKDSR